jgi:SAM-dependent methyltransferase
MNCAICGGMNGIEHTFREMMYGTRDEFAYWECSTCGCIQIVEVPETLANYYPSDYHSRYAQASPLQRWMYEAYQVWMYKAYRKAPRLAELIPPLGVTFRSVIDANPKPGARILDVGGGSGKLVAILRTLGFDATGIDPYVRTETSCVRRGRLQDVASADWDWIMFQHSLEHMTDHIGVLRSAWEKLADDGACMVRLPIANWAWTNYGRNWAQLDAPRHLIIHTLRSFRMAAEAAGFRIERTIFDSGPFQFYASEMYQRNVPLKQESSELARLKGPQLQSLKKRAAALNRQGLGDQASFHLRKIVR